MKQNKEFFDEYDTDWNDVLTNTYKEAQEPNVKIKYIRGDVEIVEFLIEDKKTEITRFGGQRFEDTFEFKGDFEVIKSTSYASCGMDKIGIDFAFEVDSIFVDGISFTKVRPELLKDNVRIILDFNIKYNKEIDEVISLYMGRLDITNTYEEILSPYCINILNDNLYILSNGNLKLK